MAGNSRFLTRALRGVGMTNFSWIYALGRAFRITFCIYAFCASRFRARSRVWSRRTWPFRIPLARFGLGGVRLPVGRVLLLILRAAWRWGGPGCLFRRERNRLPPLLRTWKNLGFGEPERGPRIVGARPRRHRQGSKLPRCFRGSASGISAEGRERRWAGRVRRRGGRWPGRRGWSERLPNFVLVLVPERRLPGALRVRPRR